MNVQEKIKTISDELQQYIISLLKEHFYTKIINIKNKENFNVHFAYDGGSLSDYQSMKKFVNQLIAESKACVIEIYSIYEFSVSEREEINDILYIYKSEEISAKFLEKKLDFLNQEKLKNKIDKELKIALSRIGDKHIFYLDLIVSIYFVSIGSYVVRNKFTFEDLF
jgi:hypothetical protein